MKGTLRYISRDASSATRTFRIEVAIPNEDKALPAGMTAEITLLAEPTDAVMLPRSVVTLSADGDLGIRAVDKDNKVVFFPIDLVDDTPNGPGARRHPGRCARHRRRPGSGHRRRRGQAGRGRSRRRSRS